MTTRRRAGLILAAILQLAAGGAQAGLLDAIGSALPGGEAKAAPAAAEAPPTAAGKTASEVAAGETPRNAAAAFDPNGDALANADQYVEVENPEKLLGIRRVVIPSFMVEFVTEAKADTRIDGIAMFSGAPSNAVVKLVGGKPETFQEITELLYQQTLQQFAAAGIEVVPLERLKQSPTYGEIAAKGEPAPREEEAKAGKGIFHSAHGLPLYYMDEVNFIPRFEIKLFKKPREDAFLTFGTRFGSGFSTAGIPQLEEKLAREFDATVLKVRLTVMGGLAWVDHSFWTGNTVTAKGAGAFAPLVNRYAFIHGNGDKARLSLKAPVSTGEIGQFVDVTSAASKAGDIARNAITIASRLAPLAGVRGVDLGYGNSRDYEWRVEPGVFESVIVKYHPAIAGMFLAKLRPPLAAR